MVLKTHQDFPAWEASDTHEVIKLKSTAEKNGDFCLAILDILYARRR